MQHFIQKYLPKLLLRLLNSGYINSSPCPYGYINGLDAVSYSELKNEVKMSPDVTVQNVIDGIDRFNSCPIYADRTTVITDEGTRDATVWDVHELRQLLKK